MRLGSTARVRLVVVAAVVALVAAGCMPADPGWTGPASGGTTFSTPGTTTFIVPAGICAVSITAEGGHGGAGFDTTAAGPGSAGGAGARVSVHVAAIPGTPFLVVVGGGGADATATSRGTGGAAGGAAGGGVPSPPVTSTSTSTTSTTGVPIAGNTGGGGGGASVVSYGTPLVVAGGGGGGAGGHAGSGGAAGPLGSPGVAGENGGGGGTVAGGGGAGGVGAGSGGGTGLAGGAGSGGGGGGAGGAGGTGFGGGGGGAELGGGGGGAGWGAGGGGPADGGGGGGSSTVALGATNVSSAPSGRNGAGQVVISWDGIDDSCPVVAPVGHVPSLARSGSSARPFVAISIDDLWGASGARDVNATMDVLASRNVKGVTFFPTGGALEQHTALGYAWVWRKVARSGSEIGNHTYTHSQLPTVSDLGIWWEMQHTQDLLNQTLGRGFAYQMHLMRPPGGAGGYGFGDPRVLGIVNSMGLSMVMWTIETHGSGPTHGAFVSSILRNAVPGSIILLHFTQITPTEIGTLIDGLRARGLEPTTVTSLFP